MKQHPMQAIYSIFFFFIKGAAAIVLLFLVFFFFSTTHTLVQKLWQYTLYSPLANFYAVSISPSIDVSRENMQELNNALVKFFFRTNGPDSLLLHVDTQILLYDQGFICRDELEDKNFAITINEAYLTKNPIYDTAGNPVLLPENKEENYLLLPEKYRSHAQEFKDYYEENNTFLKYYIDDLKTMGVEEAHQQKHDRIPTNIIYISNGQSYHVPNMEPDGKYKCTLTDPLVSVITNENVSIAQIPAYLTNQDYLVKADSQNQLSELHQIIRETGLDAFLLNFSPICQQHLSSMKIDLAFLSVYLVTILILQSITYLLTKYIIKKAGTKALITTNIIIQVAAVCLFTFLLCSLEFPVTFITIISTIFLLLTDTLLLRTALHKNKPISLNQETAYRKK